MACTTWLTRLGWWLRRKFWWWHVWRAQKVKFYSFATGYGEKVVKYYRLRHYEESSCGDCGVKYGQLHVIGCDMEHCPRCNGQVISCDCSYEGDT